MEPDMQQTPFVKQLAANDRPTRDKAVSSLRTFLAGRRKLDELELLKLWKGLFYCMWMSDRPRTQDQLATELSGLIDLLPDSTALPFLNAFWKTIAREWNGIDVLRMEKFLLLVRKYLNASFHYLAKKQWDEPVVSEYLAILEAGPLNLRDSKIPNGLRYLIMGLYIDELDEVDSPRGSDTPIEMLLEPLRKLGTQSPTKSVRERAKMSLNDKRLMNWTGFPSKGTEMNDEKDTLQTEYACDADWNGFAE
ncbi:MAG: hypothetical protein M1829_002603 [Trizodia sp. TS-e1964]|nr:MAG: hypothetical protein M1829_002603 [Trizodia sp. TS-e1964]